MTDDALLAAAIRKAGGTAKHLATTLGLEANIPDCLAAPAPEGGAAVGRQAGSPYGPDSGLRGAVGRPECYPRRPSVAPIGVDLAVHLQRGERGNFSVPATRHEIRKVTRAIGYSGPTASIRIAKGISWRVGAVKVKRFTEEVLTPLDSGVLYITSKRLLFDGQRTSTSIPLLRIIDYTSHTNGLTVEKDSGKDQFFECSADTELLCATLDGALRAVRR